MSARRSSPVGLSQLTCDLHPEELRGEEVAELAVPRGAGVQARVGAECTREVLVHADGEAEVVLAQPDRVGGQREHARRGRAAVVDVGERNPGQPQERDDRVRVVDLVAPGERELDVAPLHARVREGTTDGDRPHVDPRPIPEAAERMEPHSHDRDVHFLSSSLAFTRPSPLRRPAGMRTSRPRCHRRRCGTAPARAPCPCRSAGPRSP